MASSLRKRALGLVFLGVVACGGGVATIDGNLNDNTTNTSSSGGSSGVATSTSTATSTPTTTTTVPPYRVPKQHRAVATACDNVRSTSGPSGVPDAGLGPPVECRSHAECTQGKNGRCVGNGHDGWYCTYDACFADSECANGTGLCNCEGGFRSDHNVCLTMVGCHVDAECAPVPGAAVGFCSPTLGSCGHYAKAVGYYCHTAKDECIDDEDCKGNGQFGARPYCKFEQSVRHWKCSNQECAG